MLKFVIFTREENNIDHYKDLIDKSMINNNMYYESFSFSCYDKNFKEFCQKGYSSLVFIIDNYPNAIKLINKIKYEFDLYASFILLIDKNNDVNKDELKEEYPFLLNVINNDISINIRNSINYILRIAYKKKETFTYYTNKVLYKIPYNDILYIEKELKTKKCRIICKDNKYKTYQSLCEIEKLLDKRFFKSHQSAIVNMDNVKSIDFENSIITFNNEMVCDLISRSNKKALKLLVTK